VASCGWLAFTLAELGEFGPAQAYVDKGQAAADAARHAYSQAIAWTMEGLVSIRRGHLEAAIRPLERSLDACREAHVALWRPIPASLLGLTFVLLGRVDEGLRWLEEGVTLSQDLGINAYRALWTAQLGEGLLIAGDTARAEVVAVEALALAKAHQERGHEAWALELLAEITARRDPPDVERAEDAFRQALGLATELGMRPLLAQSHLGLGRLYQRTRRRGGAETHLSTALALFCDLDMRFWVERSWAGLKELAQLFIVARDSRPLYEYLQRMFSEEDRELVRLDRRHGERRQLVNASRAHRRTTDRRRPPSADDFCHGLMIVKPPSPEGQREAVSL
jgi:tetratricopeptide (TPR) repeat protein